MKYTNSWHLLPNEKILAVLSTDMYKGLTSADVRRRRLKNGPNGIWHIRHRSAKEIATATLFDLATLLLVVSAAVAALLDRSYEAGAIALIIVVAGIIRTVTYVRANRIFEDMAREKIPFSSVIRDGKISLIPATEIVEGDIIFLEAGDTVPCDGRVISGDEAIVSENGITENKTPVHKFNTIIKTSEGSGEVPCEFRSNMLFAGSLVLSGSVRAVACACGKRALISMKNGGIVIAPPDKMPAIDRLSKRSKTTSLIMLGCVMLLTWLTIFFRDGVTLFEVFLSTMAMAVAAMSEFLTSIGYIIIAITLRDAADGKTDGVSDGRRNGKTAASRIIIRDPDKLDELSMPDIAVFCGSRFFKSGRMELSAFRAKGAYHEARLTDEKEKGNTRSLAELLSAASAATAGNLNGLSVVNGETHVTDTAGMVSRACRAYSEAVGSDVRRSYAIIDHSAAGERHFGLDCSIVQVGGKVRLVVCGAVDAIMRCCSEAETAHGREPLTAEMRREIFTDCARLEFSGARVIAVAKKAVDSTLLEPAVMTSGMTFSGFFALSQENEKETNRNIYANAAFIRDSGVIPVLFTENPDGDLYYCHRFGLFNKKTKRITAAELDSLNMDSLTSDGLIVSFADLGGVYITTAFEKAVKCLSGEGCDKRTVITLGTDMWDMGAMRGSDIGAAVAHSGYRGVPEALSRNASVVIYPEKGKAEDGFGGFAGLVRGIKYARRAVENIDSAKIFISASQTARLVLILFSVFTSVPLMNAVFILIWGLLFDFVTALVMAFENNGRRDGYVREKFMRADDSDDRIPIHKRHNAVSAITGIVWGVLVASVVPLMKYTGKYFGCVFSPEAGAAVMAAAVIVSGVVFALETMKRDSIFTYHSPNVAQLIYIVSAFSFAALLMFTDFGARLAGGVACAKAVFAVLLPAFVILVFFEVSKAIIRYKQKKQKR